MSVTTLDRPSALVRRRVPRWKPILAMTRARVRDHQQCQVPGCRKHGVGVVTSVRLATQESLSGPQARDYVTACLAHARGAESLASGHLEARATTPAGADGTLAWYRRADLTAAFVYLGPSKPLSLPTVSA